MSSQKSTSSTVPKIFKSRKILLEILKERGFNTEDYNNFGINEIQIMINKNQLDMLLEKEETASNEKENKNIYVKYHINGKLRDTHINEYIDDLFNIDDVLTKNDELLILIMNQKINKTLEEFMKFVYIKYNIYINIININKYMFNILEHVMVPKHRVMSLAEKNQIFKMWNITDENELPEISRFDPVATIIGLRPGELCEITRSSKTAITSKYYRLCQ